MADDIVMRLTAGRMFSVLGGQEGELDTSTSYAKGISPPAIQVEAAGEITSLRAAKRRIEDATGWRCCTSCLALCPPGARYTHFGNCPEGMSAGRES